MQEQLRNPVDFLGTTDAVALSSSVSSGTPLVGALAISSAAGMQSSALKLTFSSAA